MRKISKGNVGHNNSLMEKGLLASGLGFNIPFKGEWGGSENCSVRASGSFFKQYGAETTLSHRFDFSEVLPSILC